MCKYPEIEVQLCGEDGNAFNILNIAMRAARKGGLNGDIVDEYLHEAISGDYDHLLQTTILWFNVR